jgi:hypothetical protein
VTEKPVTAVMQIWPDYSWQVAPQQSLLPLDPVTKFKTSEPIDKKCLPGALTVYM